MLKIYYNKAYKYTNRTIINLDNDSFYSYKDYVNIDSIDTINAHIIYDIDDINELPTYIINEDNNQRFFVTGLTQLRTGSYQVSLLRDVISENVELWSSEQSYISAGLADDYNKYKLWNLPYTNTKVKEQRLDISSNSSFFVFYNNTQEISGNTITEKDLKISNISVPGITNYDYIVDNLNEIPYFELVGAGEVGEWFNRKVEIIQQLLVEFIRWTYDDLYDFQIEDLKDRYDNNYITIRFYSSQLFNNNELNSKTNTRNAIKTFLDKISEDVSLFGVIKPQEQINELSKYLNKIIFNKADNKVYRINSTDNVVSYDFLLSSVQTRILEGALRKIEYPQHTYLEKVTGDWVRVRNVKLVHNFTLSELGTATSFDFNFIANQRKLPKSAVRCVNISSSSSLSITDDDIAQALMLAQTNGTNENLDTGRIIDIQYLPFRLAFNSNSNIKINGLEVPSRFLDVDDFQYDIDLPDLTNINKETDTIKIVSPSRASQFLFRPYNNNGNMQFQTKITIKPFMSVIYVRPSTQGLLINDWNDKDCLIIAEDFSLTSITSEWTNYIYQNKNYQNTFNREIQGREFNRTWEKQIEDAQALSDDWTSRNISAQKAQTYTGNLPIISGIAGAIGTAWQDNNYLEASQRDRDYNESVYQQGLKISNDLFRLQLDNIKSQPGIPTKITVVDIKMLDGIYLEFYSTNYTEIQAIKNFYIYNGNRIDCYGTFNKYWNDFIRGRIILSNNYTQPEIDELNRRLEMGVFTRSIL